MNATETKSQLAATFQANLAALRKALAANKPGAKVFAWEVYGIGVKVDADGPRVVSIDRATVFTKPTAMTFRNGADVPAVLTCRDKALRAAIAGLETTLAAFA